MVLLAISIVPKQETNAAPNSIGVDAAMPMPTPSRDTPTNPQMTISIIQYFVIMQFALR